MIEITRIADLSEKRSEEIILDLRVKKALDFKRNNAISIAKDARVAKKANLEILNDLVTEDGIDCNKEKITEQEAFERDLSLFLEKSSKDLQRIEGEVIIATVVLSGLSDTEQAEALAGDARNFEVHSHAKGVQVVVVISTINFRPRGRAV